MDPFISDDSAGLYFWSHGADPVRGIPEVQFSNRPHPLLPHHCEKHGWWSDLACVACANPYVPDAAVNAEMDAKMKADLKRMAEWDEGRKQLELFGTEAA